MAQRNGPFQMVQRAIRVPMTSAWPVGYSLDIGVAVTVCNTHAVEVKQPAKQTGPA